MSHSLQRAALVATTALAAFSVLAAAQAAGAPHRAPHDTAAARIRAHVEFLADDLLEGRAAGSHGYDVAARYVATQFELLGLKPGGTNGSWFQSIDFIEGSPVVPAGKLELIRDGKSVALESAKDFLPGVNYFDPSSTLDAGLAFVGYGVSAPERGYDDYAGVDLKGRIAVVLSGAPPTFPSEVRAHYSAGVTKLAALVRHGAVGVITVRTPWDSQRYPWESLVQSSWRPGMRWLDPSGAPADAYPQLKRTATLSPSGADALFAGAPKTLAQVFDDAQAGRAQSFEFAGLRAHLAGQTLTSKRTSANVLAVIEGSDPKLKSEYVVLTAHLDGVGRGAAVNGDSIYNGAMDNATGVAVMLEVARAVAASSARPKRSLLFAAVTAEERGLLGADYFAEHPTVPRDAIVANVNMDMPLVSAPVADLVAFGAEHSTLGAVAARAAKAEGFELTPDPRPEETVFVRSDQYPFVRRGIPAVFLTTGSRSRDPAVDGGKLFDDFIHRRYHQPSDDAQQPFDYGSLAGLARANLRIVTEVANARERPRWHSGDFFGETYGGKR